MTDIKFLHIANVVLLLIIFICTVLCLAVSDRHATENRVNIKLVNRKTDLAKIISEQPLNKEAEAEYKLVSNLINKNDTNKSWQYLINVKNFK